MPLVRCEAEGCKKKLSLIPFQCKCKKNFCDIHRYPEEHMCSFDFKESAKQILLKTMSSPVIGTKVEVI